MPSKAQISLQHICAADGLFLLNANSLILKTSLLLAPTASYVLATKCQAGHPFDEMICQTDEMICQTEKKPVTSDMILHENVQVKTMFCEGVSRVSM